MNCKDKLEAYLRENEVEFQVQHHPRAFTAQDVAASEHIPGRMVAKVVMVIAGDKLAMLAMPAPERTDLSLVAEALGSKEARLAEEFEFAPAFPDCELGAMPPFGNLYGVPVLIDRSLAEDETIVMQAGTHTDTISLKFADFERLAKPTVGIFAREKLAHYSG